MDAANRRVFGLITAIVIVVGIIGYCAWRLDVVSRRGLAGFSYVPPVAKLSNQAPMAGLQPGSVFILYPGSPADRAGLQRGDVILAINGIPASNMDKLSALSASVKRGDVIRYRISRNGELRDIAVRLDAPTSSAMFTLGFVTSVAVALMFLLIGAFVFWRRPADPRATVFYAMTLTAAVAFANTSLLQIDTSNMRGIAANQSVSDIWRFVAIGAAGLFFAPLLLHLALIFPKERPVVQRRRRIFVWIYGYPTAFVVYGAFCLVLLTAMERRSTIATNTVAATLIALAVIAVVRIVIRMIRRGMREGLLNSPIAVLTLVLSLYVGILYVGGRLMTEMKSIMPFFVATLLLVVAKLYGLA